MAFGTERIRSSKTTAISRYLKSYDITLSCRNSRAKIQLSKEMPAAVISIEGSPFIGHIIERAGRLSVGFCKKMDTLNLMELKDGETFSFESPYFTHWLKFSRKGEMIDVELGINPARSFVPAPLPRAAEIRRPAIESVPPPKPLPKTAPIGLFGDPVDKKHYVEVKGAIYFMHGDILPGHNFVLGKPETYDRELLTVNLGPGSETHKIMEAAEKIRDYNIKNEVKVLLVIGVINRFYSSDQDKRSMTGEVATLGLFQDEGGCCRHRSATLQIALQKAGVRSRYVRGQLMAGGTHAWVEIDIKGDESYSYLVDLNMKKEGKIEQVRSLPGVYKAGGLLYIPKQQGATVWRHRSNIT